MECAGATELEAVDPCGPLARLAKRTFNALEALQQAERAYHRTIAGSAFANPSEGPTAIELQKESLEQVEAARTRLDEIRTRRPE